MSESRDVEITVKMKNAVDPTDHGLPDDCTDEELAEAVRKDYEEGDPEIYHEYADETTVTVKAL